MSDYDLTEKEKKLILQNSIERVINTSIRTANRFREKTKDVDEVEEADINIENWLELKYLVVRLWERERQTIFKELRKKEEIKTSHKPSEYLYILAWGKMLGSNSSYIKMLQEDAAEDNAPLDAIYKADGRWKTFDGVTNEETKSLIATYIAYEQRKNQNEM
jgi:hypothetical protein